MGPGRGTLIYPVRAGLKTTSKLLEKNGNLRDTTFGNDSLEMSLKALHMELQQKTQSREKTIYAKTPASHVSDNVLISEYKQLLQFQNDIESNNLICKWAGMLTSPKKTNGWQAYPHHSLQRNSKLKPV